MLKFNNTYSVINRLLQLLFTKGGSWLPDKIYLKIKYFLATRHILDLNNPTRFQEKLQWLKLNDRKSIYTSMVDKYTVKKIVSEKIGSKYIIPTLGVWDSFEQIDFNSLPDKFVLKTTHGGGSLGIVICKDKQTFNYKDAEKRLSKSLKQSIYKIMREWPYKNVRRRIIAESFIECPSKTDLTDYKIFCFNGNPKFIQVIQDRNSEETIDFFDPSWTHLPFVGLTPKCQNATVRPTKPQNLDTMLLIAEQLAENTKFVRVDLYNVDGKIYFGEITFYPASGFGKFTPDIWDKKIGNMLEI